jgi:hypothetical protein
MRFNTKKSDASGAYWFAKCPKTDNDPAVADGRFLRPWTYMDKTGETLGWKTQSIEGLITGVAIKALDEDLFLNLSIGNSDVLTFKLYDNDIQALCQIFDNVNLQAPVKFVPYLQEKKAWKHPKSGKLIIPVALSIKQDGEWIEQKWKYNESIRWFDGLPKPEIVISKLGVESKDFSKRNAAFDDVIADFMTRCTEELGSDGETVGTTVINADSSNVPAEETPF